MARPSPIPKAVPPLAEGISAPAGLGPPLLFFPNGAFGVGTWDSWLVAGPGWGQYVARGGEAGSRWLLRGLSGPRAPIRATLALRPCRLAW